MKQFRLIHLGMIFVLFIATLATFGTAMAGDVPLSPPEELTIKKLVNASMTAGWEWKIEKSADVDYLQLSPGQVHSVNYAVTLTATPVAADWHIDGIVRVVNRTSGPVYIESISDQLNDGTIITLECDTPLPTLLAVDGDIQCEYDADLTNGDATSNTATVVSDYGTFTYTADIDWGEPVDMIDECIDVFDSNVPSGLGVVCAGDSPKTFNYSIEVGPYDFCGLQEINNTAYFIARDSEAYGEESEVVLVDVPCLGGCTLTPGYWKTHSRYGPSPYDDTWAQIGEDTPFSFSGKSYYQVLWTNPSGGNAYYILAHAYIAASLNQLNGADFTAAQVAFDAATLLFQTFTPAQAAALRGEERAVWINLAYTLDQYNNGLIGPGHCDF